MSNQYNIPEDINERFWQKVTITANPDLCWEWLFRCNEDGYGVLTYKQKHYYAHRMAWELTNGSIQKGMCVLHKCDNPPCCNPHHLFLGTHKQNMEDKVKKGRQPKGDAIRQYVKGELQGAHKLTRLQVNEIRQRYAMGGITYTRLGKEMGVCAAHIGRIVRYLEWQD